MLGIAAGSCSPRSETPPPRPRHFLLLSIDTLRADHLGCYGYDRPVSPNLDRFAREGARFDSATAPSPWTLPSHASLFTGHYPRRHGLLTAAQQIPADLPTLAESLQQAGLATGAIVNVGLLAAKRGFSRGFDDYRVVPPATDPAGSAPAIVSQALEWLNRPADQGSFLFLHVYDVHTDYQPASPYREQLVRPYSGAWEGTNDFLKQVRRSGQPAADAADTQHLIDLYDAGLRQLDADLAALLEWLQDTPRGRETLVVITSDHGEEFLDHGGVLHSHTLYEELVRIPLIVVGPGIKANHVVRGAVSLVDVMPTAVPLLTGSAPAATAGWNLGPWLRSEQTAPTRPIFSEADRWYAMRDGQRRRMVRRDNLKLHWDSEETRPRLYDLATDPGERHDIAADRPEEAAALLRDLAPFLRPATADGEGDLELTAEDRALLEALGYADGDS